MSSNPSNFMKSNSQKRKNKANEQQIDTGLNTLQLNASTDDLGPTAQKQQKVTPIMSLQNGEMNRDITLKIISTEAKTIKGGQIYVVLATDAYNFIHVEAYNQNLDKLLEVIKPEQKGRICYLSNVQIHNIKPQFNYGTVDVAIRIGEHSKIHLLDKVNDPVLIDYKEQEKFYHHQLEKFRLDLAETKTSLLKMNVLKAGQINACIQFKVNSIQLPYPIQVPNVSIKSKLFSLGISQNGQAAKLSAWNFEAEFLAKYLENAEGHEIICKNLHLKLDPQYGIQFTFGRQSKILLLELEVKLNENAPTTLKEVVQTALSGRQSLNIPLQLLEDPSPFAKGKKIVTASDGSNKCQLFIPSSFELTKGTEINLVIANVQRLVSGVLNITLSSEADYKPIPGAQASKELPDITQLTYPKLDAE